MSTRASSPFDHPKADVILRSSDGVNFHVFKLFLTLVSPFFEAMFELPQPTVMTTGDVNDGLPVIIMQEDSGILDMFLRFCYPSTLAEDPSLENPTDILAILGAARKYSLDLIERKVCQALANSKLLEAEPLRCFAIARNARFKHETITAARYTLRQPLIPARFAEIDLITASDFLALLTYHERCSSAVASLANLDWLREHYGGSSGRKWFFGMKAYSKSVKCFCEQSSSSTRFKLWDGGSMAWWADYMRDTFMILKDCPSGAKILAEGEKMIQKVIGSGCSACITLARGPGDMQEFSNFFALKVDEVTASVCIPA